MSDDMEIRKHAWLGEVSDNAGYARLPGKAEVSMCQ